MPLKIVMALGSGAVGHAPRLWTRLCEVRIAVAVATALVSAFMLLSHGDFESRGGLELQAQFVKSAPLASASSEKRSSGERLAVVTLSVGTRPHFHAHTRPAMAAYAAKVGADFIALPTGINDVLANLGMQKVSVRFEKLMIGRLLGDSALPQQVEFLGGGNATSRRLSHGYDRVLWLDDSVMIHPDAPDVFKIVPKTMLGAAYERWHGTRFNQVGIGAACAHYFGKPFAQQHLKTSQKFFNSGVMLISREQRTLFETSSWDKLQRVGPFEDQAYFNAMRAKQKIPVFDLGVPFNFVGSQTSKPTAAQLSGVGLTMRDACFVHLTRGVCPGAPPCKAGVEEARVKLLGTLAHATPHCLRECGAQGCWAPGREPHEAEKIVVADFEPEIQLANPVNFLEEHEEFADWSSSLTENPY